MKRYCLLFFLNLATLSYGANKVMTAEAQNVSITINRKATDVYSYASNPENLPKWAAGLSKSKLEKSGEFWLADSPMGRVKIKFAEKNGFGILDHDVTLPNGVVAHNPLRVVPNLEGSEVIFTVFRAADKSEQDFAKDVGMVEKDLKTLKNNLETRH